MNCKKCQNNLTERDVFCSLCGARVARAPRTGDRLARHFKERFIKIYNYTLLCAYFLTLLTCAIVDLALNKGLHLVLYCFKLCWPGLLHHKHVL